MNAAVDVSGDVEEVTADHGEIVMLGLRSHLVELFEAVMQIGDH